MNEFSSSSVYNSTDGSSRNISNSMFWFESNDEVTACEEKMIYKKANDYFCGVINWIKSSDKMYSSAISLIKH
jgi:hypothetical protein